MYWCMEVLVNNGMYKDCRSYSTSNTQPDNLSGILLYLIRRIVRTLSSILCFKSLHCQWAPTLFRIQWLSKGVGSWVGVGRLHRIDFRHTTAKVESLSVGRKILCSSVNKLEMVMTCRSSLIFTHASLFLSRCIESNCWESRRGLLLVLLSGRHDGLDQRTREF